MVHLFRLTPTILLLEGKKTEEQNLKLLGINYSQDQAFAQPLIFEGWAFSLHVAKQLEVSSTQPNSTKWQLVFLFFYICSSHN
jgi:hypothetical protein